MEAISKKHPREQDWKNVQTKLNDLLNKNPTLAEHYQQFSAQLRTWTDEDLWTLLPPLETINLFQPQRLPTLGYTPGQFVQNKDELDNIVVVVTQIILRHGQPAEMSTKLVQQPDKLTPNQPKNSKK